MLAEEINKNTQTCFRCHIKTERTLVMLTNSHKTGCFHQPCLYREPKGQGVTLDISVTKLLG